MEQRKVSRYNINKAIIQTYISVFGVIIVSSLVVVVVLILLNITTAEHIVGTVVNTVYDQTYEGAKPRIVAVLRDGQTIVVDAPKYSYYNAGTKISLIKMRPKYFGKVLYKFNGIHIEEDGGGNS
jgi:hypothetical protein